MGLFKLFCEGLREGYYKEKYKEDPVLGDVKLHESEVARAERNAIKKAKRAVRASARDKEYRERHARGETLGQIFASSVEETVDEMPRIIMEYEMGKKRKW